MRVPIRRRSMRNRRRSIRNHNITMRMGWLQLPVTHTSGSPDNGWASILFHTMSALIQQPCCGSGSHYLSYLSFTANWGSLYVLGNPSGALEGFPTVRALKGGAHGCVKSTRGGGLVVECEMSNLAFVAIVCSKTRRCLGYFFQCLGARSKRRSHWF